MNWIFKKDDHFKFNSNKQKAVVTIIQKRYFTGEVDEAVLILEKEKVDWEFTSLYRIEEINVKDSESEYKTIIITLRLVQQFKEQKLLEDYVYSLRRITNYANPVRHFSRKYTRLYDAEFEAIVEDKIYLKRTILGTVLNAMHRDHQIAFIAYIAQESPELLLGKTEIDKALRLLLTYLDFAIIKPAEYLKESAVLLQNIVNQQEYAQIGFGKDAENLTSKNVNLIQPQVETIELYLNDFFGFKNEKLGLQLLELDENQKFKRLFKNTPLPLTLN